MALQIGDIAPDFEGPHDGKSDPVSLWIGDSWAVLFSLPEAPRTHPEAAAAPLTGRVLWFFDEPRSRASFGDI